MVSDDAYVARSPRLEEISDRCGLGTWFLGLIDRSREGEVRKGDRRSGWVLFVQVGRKKKIVAQMVY